MCARLLSFEENRKKEKHAAFKALLRKPQNSLTAHVDFCFKLNFCGLKIKGFCYLLII